MDCFVNNSSTFKRDNNCLFVDGILFGTGNPDLMNDKRAFECLLQMLAFRDRDVKVAQYSYDDVLL